MIAARLLRRKRLVRTTLVGAGLLGALLTGLIASRSEEAYRPGEKVDGLVDTLRRGLPADAPPVTAADVSAEAGVRFLHFPGTRSNRLPEDMGSGLAWGDADGDGWNDLYLVNIAPTDIAPTDIAPTDGTAGATSTGDAGPGDPGTAGRALPDAAAARDGRCRLFLNAGDGHFADATDKSATGLRLTGHAAAFADLEGDGDLDLLVTGLDRVVALVNAGDARFTDGSDGAGLSGLRGFLTGLALADIDRDGDLDAYVCRYVRWDDATDAPTTGARQYELEIPAMINPSAFEPDANLLLLNDGSGRFEDVAAGRGVDDPHGRSLGVTAADLTGDGWPDLYVANDVSDNALFASTGGGRFEDITTRALVGDYRGAMGLAVGDFDGDLDPDLFITHWIGQENALYVNLAAESAGAADRPPFLAVDEADRHGLGQSALDRVGWATGFLDVDLDGRWDLFVVNGHTIPDPADRTRLQPQSDQLFWNAGPGRGCFDIGPAGGEPWRTPAVGRGGAACDYDLDGDADLAVVHHGALASLLRFDGAPGHPLVVRLRQPSGNTFALGARIELRAGDRRSVSWLGSDGSYLSQHAVGEAVFGLADAARADELCVTWPDGTTETAGPFLAGSLVTWTRGAPPVARTLPGLAAARADGPAAIADRKRFHALMDEASHARIAGDPAAAVALAEQACALWPGHEGALYDLGNGLLETGDEARARETFRDLVGLHPRAARGWMQLGRLALPGGDPGLDDLPAARDAFERAHAINGEEGGPVAQLGVTAMLEGDLGLAAKFLGDAAALDPRQVEARWWLGLLAWRRGDRDRAQAWLDEARRLAAPAAAPRASAASSAAATAPDAGPGAGTGPAPGATSASNEGDTRSGKAQLAESAEQGGGHALVDRWRTLGDRGGDAATEYGALAHAAEAADAER